MKKRYYFVIIGLILAVLLVAVVVDRAGNANQSTNSINSNKVEPSSDISSGSVITVEVLRMHNTKDDCWTAVDGKVYDITSYIPRHPGGDEILLACGTDGTSLFTQRQTSDGQNIGSGTPHSKSATNQLDSYFIGDLDSN